MKHLLLPILLIFLLALPFTGCQKHYPVADKLSQAEICMDEEPEAALRVLESIGQPDLHTKEHHARYALLYSQALDKNYIDKTNDSLIIHPCHGTDGSRSGCFIGGNEAFVCLTK